MTCEAIESEIFVSNNGKKYNLTTTLDRSGKSRSFWSYLAMFLWVGWTSFYFFFTLSLPIVYIYRDNKYLLYTYTTIFSFMIISAIFPINRKLQPKLAFKLGEWIMNNAADYFKMRVIHENLNEINKHKQVVYALEPHDVLPLSIFVFNDCLNTFPGQKCLGCVTGACFNVPLMRHMYTWVNATDVGKKNLLKLISNGISPVICPGGVQEVTLMSSKDECVLYLKERKGFVKLAIQHGLPLVPAFTFGLKDSFDYWVPKGKFWTKLARQIGFLPMAFFGVFSLPLGPAKPVQYTVIAGSPIIVGAANPEPTIEEINKYHSMYIEELVALYERHKGAHGMDDIVLRIA